MKKLVLSALVLGSAFAAAPAFAQASGSVDVSGTVSARCSAVTPISGSITLGELAKADGTIDAAFSSNTGGLTRNFTIKCNGANPKVSVDAKPLGDLGDRMRLLIGELGDELQHPPELVGSGVAHAGSRAAVSDSSASSR